VSAVITIPELRTADAPSVALQAAAVAGSILNVVSIRDHGGQRLDRWFATEAEALAHAVTKADGLGLILFDLRDPGAAE